MSEKKFKVTPKGNIYYPFLFNPSTKFNPEGVFKVDLELDPNMPEHKSFLSELKTMTPKGEKPPYKKQKHPESGEDTGNYIVSFKTTYKPQVFDAKGKSILNDCKVGNGTLARISYEANHYKGFGGGINLYLKGVQILDLVEYTGASADYFGFDEQDGFEVNDDPFNKGQELTEIDKKNIDEFSNTEPNIDDFGMTEREKEARKTQAEIEQNEEDDMPF